MVVINTIGISGCGKSTFIQKLMPIYGDAVEINYDDIRKKLGNVSDQSKNGIIMDYADAMVYRSLYRGSNIFFSNTCLKPSYVKNISKYANRDCIHYFTTHLVFLDSLDPELCAEMVKKALENGEDRSNTLAVIEKFNSTVIEKQYNDFIHNFGKTQEEIEKTLREIVPNDEILFIKNKTNVEDVSIGDVFLKE
jgi:predicted kinase